MRCSEVHVTGLKVGESFKQFKVQKGDLFLGDRGFAHRAGISHLVRINLTKLKSRPSKDRPWDYVFYVDFEGHSDDPGCREAIADLNKTTFLKILGSYSTSS